MVNAPSATSAFKDGDSFALTQGALPPLVLYTFRSMQIVLRCCSSNAAAVSPVQPYEAACVKVMRIPCFGRRMTIGRASII